MIDESDTAVALLEGEHRLTPHGPLRDGQCFDPQLARTLYNLLNWVDLSDAALPTELEKLEVEHADAVYVELIFMLSHLRFDGAVARRHWSNVIDHRRRMAAKLETTVDLRVALVSYFLEVNRSLRNPKIIEMRVFEQTRATAYWDDLTGLRNYRFFSEHLNQEMLRSQVSGEPLSLVMVDIDDFKMFNDHFGHEAGNEALTCVAKQISGALRPADVVARYGGEEFALVLASTPKQEAREIAERVRRAVCNMPPLQRDRKLTISLGVATHPADACGAGELVRHADRALYAAKFGGKNQVRLFRESTRSFARVDAALCGSFTSQSLESSSMTTVKISQGGLQFHCARHLVERSLLEFQIELPDGEGPVTVVGRVVRVDRHADSGFGVAVRFVDVEAADRMRLTSHIEAQSGRPPSAT